MADDNDDSWLYGGGPDEASHEGDKQDEEEVEVTAPVKNGNAENKTYDTFDEHNFEEAGDHEHLIAEDSKDGEADGGTQGGDSDDSDDDDDDINVVIGDIKSGGTSYVKGPQDKQKLPGSKFNIEEFESVGSINGQPAFEFAIENIEDKPWRKPGADITDYFNYGFNEETWRAYCERQKKMRIHESGVGLAGLTAAQNPQGNMDQRQGINIGIKRIGGPRPKPSGIDVIGAPSQNPIRPPAPRENIIQVMTADRREYSRTVVGNTLPNQPIPINFSVPPEEFYNHEEQDAFNYGYEPTQDSQWEPQNPGWAPSEIKELTGMNQPPPMMGLSAPPPMITGISPRMPPNMIPPPGPAGIIPSLMSQVTTMPQSLKPADSRDRRERETRHYDDSRKRPRERSASRDRERKERERTRDERSSSKYDREGRESRYRETSSRRETRRSKSREKTKRSKSKEKSRRSRSKDRKTEDKEKDRTRSDKSKRSKKEGS